MSIKALFGAFGLVIAAGASTAYAQAIEIAEKTFGVDNPQTAALRSAREQLSAK